MPFPSSGPRLELPERPLSALSQATTASSASGGLRDRREVSQLNVNVPPSAVPFLSSRLRVESGATGRDSGSLGGGSTTAASDEPARSTSQPTHEGDWIHAAQPQPSAIGHLNGLGLALNVDAVSEPSTDEDGSDDEDAAEQLEPEEQAIFDRPTIHESARDWGEEDFEGDANDRDEGTSRPRLGSMRRPSAATFRGGNSSWLNPPASAASTGTGEEWRSRILESVRKGEERVAERRKVSVASVQTFDAGKTPLATVAALPTVPDESSSSSAPLPVDGEADRAAEPEAAIALPSPTTVDSRPLSPSLPPQASLDLPLPPSPTYSTSSHSPSFHSQRSSAALLPPSPTDERTRAHHPRGPALPPAPSPLAEGGTFLSVADPSAFTMRGSGLLSSPAPPSPARRTVRDRLVAMLKIELMFGYRSPATSFPIFSAAIARIRRAAASATRATPRRHRWHEMPGIRASRPHRPWPRGPAVSQRTALACLGPLARACDCQVSSKMELDRLSSVARTRK